MVLQLLFAEPQIFGLPRRRAQYSLSGISLITMVYACRSSFVRAFSASVIYSRLHSRTASETAAAVRNGACIWQQCRAMHRNPSGSGADAIFSYAHNDACSTLFVRMLHNWIQTIACVRTITTHTAGVCVYRGSCMYELTNGVVINGTAVRLCERDLSSCARLMGTNNSH